MRTADWRADLCVLLAALLWGTTFVLVKHALADVSPSLFLALRFTLAVAVLGLAYVLRGRWRNRRGLPWAGLLTGCLLYSGYLLQTIGLGHTTPAKSAFLTGLYIVLVPVLSAFIARRPPRAAEWVGVASATGGMALLSLDLRTFRIGYGDLLTIACAFAFAAHMLVLSHYSRKMDTEWLNILQIGACAVIGLTTFRFLEQPYFRATPTSITALLVTSLLATVVAFWAWTWAQARTSATRAALLFSMEPVFAWCTSFLFEGERLTAQALSGAVLILGGVLTVELMGSGERDSAA